MIQTKVVERQKLRETALKALYLESLSCPRPFFPGKQTSHPRYLVMLSYYNCDVIISSLNLLALSKEASRPSSKSRGT